MPSNYTGNPTATQSPGPTPGPQAIPIGALVVDGDTRNAASLAQPMKEPLDFIAWLMDPFAPAASLLPIQRYRNQRLLSRMGFDRRGYDGGRVLRFDEDWIGFDTVTSPATAQSKLPRWTYNVTTGSAGIIESRLAGNSFAPSALAPGLELSVPQTLAAITEIYTTVAHMTATADLDAVLETEILNATGIADPTATYICGITDPGTTTLSSIANGAWFQKIHTVANWQCVTGDGSTTTVVDSGVSFAAGVLHRLRVELTGANAADGSANIARFFIDGTAVDGGGLTTHLPFVPGTTPLSVRCGGVFTGGSAAAAILALGPLHYRQNTIAGNSMF